MRAARHLLILAIVGVCGCGIRYGDGPHDLSLPKDFVNRVLYSDTSIAKYRLDYLVGAIMVCSPASGGSGEACELTLERLIKAQTAPEAMDPKTEVYHSLITQGASVQGSYLAFAANFASDQVAALTITDTTLLAIKADDVPLELIRNYLAAHPPINGKTRYWIEGALLSVIDRQDSSKIDADASGVLGSTAGVKGKVYHMDEKVSKDFAIALFRRNIDSHPDKSVLPANLKVSDREASRVDSLRGAEHLLIP